MNQIANAISAANKKDLLKHLQLLHEENIDLLRENVSLKLTLKRIQDELPFPEQKVVIWPTDTMRMDVIGQNGNDGLHYERPED